MEAGQGPWGGWRGSVECLMVNRDCWGKKIARTVLLPKHQRTLEQIRWHWSSLGRVCLAEAWMAREYLPLCRRQLSLRAGSRVLKAEPRHPVSVSWHWKQWGPCCSIAGVAKTLGADTLEDVALSVGLFVYTPQDLLELGASITDNSLSHTCRGLQNLICRRSPTQPVDRQ